MALTGRHLKVAVDQCTPWVEFKSNFQDISGVAWGIFTSIAQQLNFTYDFFFSVFFLNSTKPKYFGVIKSNFFFCAIYEN